MQFIANGPDVPDSLLRAHEEGRVVFFCGAGISYSAGLPGFAGLVEKIYVNLGVTPDSVQQAAIKAGQFDTAISLLESNIVGGREYVRKALAAIPTPNLTAKNATNIHESLLILGKLRDGRTRLITTNFDRVFEEVIAAKSQPIERFLAPLLPIPKNRWDGLVYLHGLLTTSLAASELDRLVISSGDFGLAYLTERWAARFVSELLRNYSVCFIGYSINDPVLRYMMDALAADRLRGETPPEMFAFGSYPKGRQNERANEWLAKNVTPILYRERNHHAYLRQTLHKWAETYRDGMQGKSAIVSTYATTHPQRSTPQDNLIDRMLWALSDPSGLPAKHFANFNPAPPLEWLFEAFSPPLKENTKPSINLMRRPAPNHLMPLMQLVSIGNTENQWDDTMSHLAQWLVRHLGDPRLMLWVSEQGGQLHVRWQNLIENKLDQLALLKCKGKAAELEEIRLHAPNAIPDPMMRTLWRFLLNGWVKSPRVNLDLYQWKERFEQEGMTATLRLKLRQLLAPKLTLKKPYIWDFYKSSHADSTDKPMQLEKWMDYELKLTTDYVRTILPQLEKNKNWRESLPLLLEDFQQLLRDALDLLRELGKADDRNDDLSYLILPSITPHWQNHEESEDWRILIELVRDAWIEVHIHNPAHATRIAQNWFEYPYPTFKRLALFAASQSNGLSPEQWVDWLLADDAWWLWAIDTRREVCRLLVLQGQHLTDAVQARLEAAVLAGPLREMYQKDLEEHTWQDLVALLVWLRLSKLSASGLTLGARATTRLNEISAANPQWQLASNERDEFSYWSSSTVDPDHKEERDINIAPRKRQDLVLWLKNLPPEEWPSHKDTWYEVCQKHPLNCLLALADLAKQDEWPWGRWKNALHAWSSRKQIQHIWFHAAPLVQTMPDAVLQELANDVTQWLGVVSTSIHHHEEIFLDLCRRALELPLEIGSGYRMIQDGIETYDTVDSTKSHAIGHTTQALINLWFKQNPSDNDLLPETIKPLFTMLCDVKEDRFRYGRALIGSQLAAFFHVDRPWTEQHLLPLLNWNNPVEAKAVWEGFLLSPSLHLPLLIAFKPDFLESAHHYADLGRHRQQFARFLTLAALDQTEGYTVKEFRSAIDKLPAEGLETSALMLCQRLEGAAGQREEFWKNYVQPFWHKIWPKSRDRVTSPITKHLTRLVLAAGDAFPAALDEVRGWLCPLTSPDYVIHQLYESALCQKFPVASLEFLSAVVSDQQWSPSDLANCLDEIKQSDPSLIRDSRYKQLLTHATKH